MIILRSDYSPQAAPELQEKDNIEMLYAALYCAGMKGNRVDQYRLYSESAAENYTEALGEPDEKGQHTDQQWQDAIEAAAPSRELAERVLMGDGITIQNKMIEAIDDSHFPHIETTVYKLFNTMEPVARIERPVMDIEAKHYKDNVIGSGRNKGHG